MPSDLLGSLAVSDLLRECADAATYITIDEAGSQALLGEARRRMDVGELEPSAFELVRTTLQICGEPLGLRTMRVAMDPSDPWHGLRRALLAMVGDQPLSFLYHGTLRSRLVGIARDGLRPAKRAKSWPGIGVTEHATTGVFFARSWRSASNWVGAAAYSKERVPIKGAVLRIPVRDLVVEDDIRSEGSIVVRKDRIPVHDAEVLLFPFTVTNRWMPILDAVEEARRLRQSASRLS